jgi:hypothetical protein
MGNRSNVLGNILLIAGMFAIGYALSRDPGCRGGCKSLAQHLIAHGWEGLLGLI